LGLPELIVFRYLSKQVLQVMSAVTLIVLIVALTSRFIQYLGDAVAGELASDVLLLLMLYRLPDFLLVIIPLALFLGFLLAYGRMYADNEMMILASGGVSPRRLLLLSTGSAGLALIIVSLLALWLAPWGVRNTEQLKQGQEQLTEVDLIVAGQFQSFGDGRRVTHTERTSGTAEIGRSLENVFVAINNAEESPLDAPRIMLAETARPEVDAATGARFMRLENVLQYDGTPGSREFSIGQFDVQSILLPEPTPIDDVLEEATLSTLELLSSSEPAHQAELQWRISVLLLIPVITLIAVPLSHVNPRQGRYSKLVPAALLYATYFVLLQVARDMLADGELSPLIGMWWVHIIFLALGLALYRYPEMGRYFALGRGS